jgi:uncharacterized membrane protein (UPF0127 family)
MSQFIKNYKFPLFEDFCKKDIIDGKKILAKISNIPLKLKVASTQKSQIAGFSKYRKPLDDSGILFVYDKEEPLSFWMKGVNFPLDIIFFDSNLDYINHETMQPSDKFNSNDLPKYISKRPAQFAVELPSGWCKKNLTSKCKLSF